ncbi:uncharacterized protein ACN427_000469 [Glossina fuscipes fuscipes]
MPDKHLFITCSYIPPNSDISIYGKHAALICEVAKQSRPTDLVVALGDFNLPQVTWCNTDNSGCLVPTSTSDRAVVFFNELFDHNLGQYNRIPNCNGRLLDFCFANFPEIYVNRCPPFSLPEDPYHPSICISFHHINDGLLECLNVPTQTCLNNYYDFHKINIVLLKHRLSHLTLDFSTGSIENLMPSFYNTLNLAIAASVPIKHCRPRSRCPPWFNKTIKYHKNRKNSLFKKYSKSGSALDYVAYSVARHRFNSLNHHYYCRCLQFIKSSLFANPKFFFKFVNSKRKISTYPSHVSFNGSGSSDDFEISNLFAEYFRRNFSIANSELSANYPYPITNSVSIPNLVISEDDVFKGLSSLKYSCSPGPDGIPSCVLKSCAVELCGVISKIFNMSLCSGVFPSCWKSSFLIPIHKSGSRQFVENYRGIAKLSVLPKLFERIVTQHLAFAINSYISPHQHGLRKGRSTVTNLLEFTCHVFKAFSSGSRTDVIYTDLSKAFDLVNHRLLIFKLQASGFPPYLVKWISSYLHNRSFRVLFNFISSDEFPVTSGVPQGSHLGPILFSLYINDLPSVVNSSQILMYADDVKLFSSFSVESQSHQLQGDLDNFVAWCSLNLLQLNLSKCKKLSFSRRKSFITQYFIDSHKLEDVDSITDLGVLFDHRLRFNLHIELSISKARSALGFIKRWSKELDDPYITKRLYMCLVRPILEYASVVWSPSYRCYVDSIESVQKQFLLFALRNLGWDPIASLPPYENRLLLLSLPSLEKRRFVLGVSFLIKVINGAIDSPSLLGEVSFNVPNRFSRHFILVKLNQCKFNYELFNPLRVVCKNLNDVYHLFSLSDSLKSIKAKLLNTRDLPMSYLN